MKKAFGSLAVLWLGLGLMGCEAQECDVQTASGETRDGVCLKSLTRFEGTNPIVGQAQWTPGAPITIDGRNGDIEVVRGSSDVVRATFHPVVYLAYDSSDERVNGEFDKLNADVTGDAGGVSGAVLVKTSRDDGAASTLGADFTVEIPPTFDGVLTVEQDNGQTDVDFAGSATSVKVHSDNGGCTITSSPAAIETNFHCENGDLAANIPGAPAGAGTRSIRTGGNSVGSGEIGLSFVGVSQPFNVQAQALGGLVNLVNDARCTTQTAGAGSKTVSCNGGNDTHPTYVVRAERLSDITLTF
jgi:hypothetical protein